MGCPSLYSAYYAYAHILSYIGVDYGNGTLVLYTFKMAHSPNNIMVYENNKFIGPLSNFTKPLKALTVLILDQNQNNLEPNICAGTL